MGDPTVHDVNETTTGDGTATTTTTGGRKKGQQIIKERRERVYGTSKKDFQREGRQLSVDFGDGGEVMTEAELRQMFNADPQGHQHFKSYKKQFVTDKQTWHQFKRGKNLDAVDTGEKQGLIPRIKERKLDKKIDAVNPDMVEGWAYNYQTNQKRSADAKIMQQLLIDAGYPVGETGADGRWTEQSQTAYDKWKEDGGYQPGKVKKFFQGKATTIRDRKSTKFKNRELDKKLAEYTPDQIQGWQNEYDADPEAVNEDVKVLQQFLIDRGFGNVIDSDQYIPGVDGRFGPETKS